MLLTSINDYSRWVSTALRSIGSSQGVEIHLIPNTAQQATEARIWWDLKMLHSVNLPLAGLRVHFSTLANSHQQTFEFNEVVRV